MKRPKCACLECKHNNDRYLCNADRPVFSFANILTVNNGRMDVWICKTYEMSERTKEIEEAVAYAKQKRGDI